MNRFNYPTTVFHGSGALAGLGKYLAKLGLGRLMLVTDPGLVAAGLAERVAGELRGNGLTIEVYSQVHPNPIEADVVAGAQRYKEGGFQGIVALGGGSPIDAAKAIAVLATHPGPLAQYDDTKGGDQYIVNPVPPLFAIATTAGTGSEVGRSAVIIINGIKTIIFHPTLMPRVAVLDPELTVGLPPHITAATGMDAFTHCLEAYLAKGYHPMADAIALGGMKLAVTWLRQAVEHGDDIAARENMLMASAMGATAFQKGLGMVHSLAHPLSVRYGMHHGLANALLLAPTLEYQLKRRGGEFSEDLKQRYQTVVELMPGAKRKVFTALPRVVRSLCEGIGISGGLAAQGVQKADIPGLVDEAVKDPCHTSNPIPCTAGDFKAAYKRAM